jgi:hypothetical protein
MGIVATKGFVYRGVPKKLVLELIEKATFNYFLETGTFMGETALWASNFFENVISIEASSELHQKLPLVDNINFVLGDSSVELTNYLKDNMVLYLDAHYSFGNTFNSYPLLKELTQINSAKFENQIIIIDDARFCMSKWNDEDYGDFSMIIKLVSFEGKRYLIVFDDMIIAVPFYLRNCLDEFINNESKTYWSQYLLDVKEKEPNVILAIKKFLKKTLISLGFKFSNMSI